MTFSRDLIEDLKNEVESKKLQRKSALDMLTTVDAYIDKMDDLIKKIDSDIPALLDEVNSAITDVEVAYQNRVAIGCSSGLAWTEIEDGLYIGDLQVLNFNRWEVTVDSETTVSDPLFGLKYYRKPLNRDYGTTIVKEIEGSIESGSSTLSVITLNGINGIQIGDYVSDDITSSIAFDSNVLPKVVGFGTTTYNFYNTVIGGSVSAGSTIFIHVGIGSTSNISIGDVFYNENYVAPNTTVVGFGTTSTSVNVLDYTVGVPLQTSIYITTNTILLSNPVSFGGTNVEFEVGVMSPVSSIMLSTSSNENINMGNFSILRVSEDPDLDFDYTKNPLNPITVGIIDSSTLGVGHTVEIINNGSPNQTRQWDTGIDEDPPDVGAGSRTYVKGSLEWPIIITCVGSGPYTCIGTYAPLGTVAIANTTTSIGITSISPTGLTPDSPICVSYANSITAAENRLESLRRTNLSKARELMNASMALRRLRDDKELYAWSLLQGSSYLQSEYGRLESEINSLLNTNFIQFES